MRKDIDTNLVIKDYIAGASLWDLAKKYKCSESTIKNRIKTNEECVKIMKNRTVNIDKNNIIKLFLENKSLDEIANIYCKPKDMIKKILEDTGDLEIFRKVHNYYNINNEDEKEWIDCMFEYTKPMNFLERIDLAKRISKVNIENIKRRDN